MVTASPAQEFWDGKARLDAGWHAVMTSRWSESQCVEVHQQMQALIVQTAVECAVDPAVWLDVGCGVGNFILTPALLGGTKQILGVDLSREMCVRAAASHVQDPQVHIVQAAVSALPITDAAVTCACSVAVMQHLPSVTALHQAGVQLDRVLVPGGIMIMLEGTLDAHVDGSGREPVLAGRTATTLFSVQQYQDAMGTSLRLATIRHVTFVEDRYTCMVWRKLQ